MAKIVEFSTIQQATNRRQAYTLLTLGVVFLVLAWILHPNPLTYPLGLFLFGVGMLIGAFFNPYRLMISGILVTLIGASIFLAYKQSILPDAGNLIVLAIGLGLVGIALAARRGYVTTGPLTPAVIVILVGLVEYGPTAHYLPSGAAPFILSLWFPGLGLLLLGLVYFFISRRR
ncbi:MAG: hypothetical protein NVS4B12_26880 [Ktedonobacteraceae bacterium]